MSKVCSVCGTTNPEGAEFCEGCGIELAVASESPVTPAPGAMPGKEAEAAPSPVQGGAEVATGQASPVSEGQTPLDVSPAPDEDSSPSANNEEEEGAVAEAPAPSTHEAAPAKLLAKRHGAVSGDPIPLLGERLVVGRFDPSSGPVDIDVAGMAGAEHISRRHAELYLEAGTWKVRDLGSTNGVFLKRVGEDGYGPRLQEPAELNDGDEVAFGNVVFVFRQGEL